MPYQQRSDLPKAIKSNLPAHAQDIWKEAYNSAWGQYKNPNDRWGKVSREEVSAKVAWNAVKQKYKKSDEADHWVEK